MSVLSLTFDHLLGLSRVTYLSVTAVRTPDFHWKNINNKRDKIMLMLERIIRVSIPQYPCTFCKMSMYILVNLRIGKRSVSHVWTSQNMNTKDCAFITVEKVPRSSGGSASIYKCSNLAREMEIAWKYQAKMWWRFQGSVFSLSCGAGTPIEGILKERTSPNNQYPWSVHQEIYCDR